jgi:hypothetical protein
VSCSGDCGSGTDGFECDHCVHGEIWSNCWDCYAEDLEEELGGDIPLDQER